MKNPTLSPVSQATKASVKQTEDVFVHDLVSKLMNDLIPSAVARHSFLINNIPADFVIRTDKELLATVLWNLINNSINSTYCSCIRIDLSLYDTIVSLRVNDRAVCFNNEIAFEIKKVQKVAEKLGGSICIDTNRVHGTTFVFTLYNVLKAA